MPVIPAIGAIGGVLGGAATVIGATRKGGGGGYTYAPAPSRELTPEEVRLAELQTITSANLQAAQLNIADGTARAMNAALLSETTGKKWLGVGAGVFLLGILFLIFKKKKLLEI